MSEDFCKSFQSPEAPVRHRCSHPRCLVEYVHLVQWSSQTSCRRQTSLCLASVQRRGLREWVSPPLLSRSINRTKPIGYITSSIFIPSTWKMWVGKVKSTIYSPTCTRASYWSSTDFNMKPGRSENVRINFTEDKMYQRLCIANEGWELLKMSACPFSNHVKEARGVRGALPQKVLAACNCSLPQLIFWGSFTLTHRTLCLFVAGLQILLVNSRQTVVDLGWWESCMKPWCWSTTTRQKKNLLAPLNKIFQ